MKHLVLFIGAFLIIGYAGAQTLSDFAKAFKNSNTSYLTANLDNSVEITLDGKNSTYNKGQASKLLTDFFNNNRVTDFKVIHQSESGATAYCIGNLATSGGTFRTTLFTKEKNGRYVLQEIRFEK